MFARNNFHLFRKLQSLNRIAAHQKKFAIRQTTTLGNIIANVLPFKG